MTSTYDSAESIATLLNRIWTMIKFGICWLHRCSYNREKPVHRPTTSLSLLPGKLSVRFISFPSKCREICRIVLTSKQVESRHIFSDRNGISEGHQTNQGKGVSFFKFSEPEEASRTVLENRLKNREINSKKQNLKF